MTSFMTRIRGDPMQSDGIRSVEKPETRIDAEIRGSRADCQQKVVASSPSSRFVVSRSWTAIARVDGAKVLTSVRFPSDFVTH
jgi:hypothetical protein